ncbi:MAG: phosphonate ABC transporter substrate-binding protein, partial [Proteobacteria bacterium]|nr:phosphonate ABC transporter substrate-binding protein [Pseudomonadota bacterium]MBU1456543.1 phosphonate ABC transporter substrate-binding protein [Pseudomonadota bacterium]
MKRILSALAAVLVVANVLPADASAQQQWPEEITFGVIPVASSRNMSDSFGNLVQHLEKELGIK